MLEWLLGAGIGPAAVALPRTIARGLLEFAVADLDPKFFQQLLLTRLNRSVAAGPAVWRGGSRTCRY